MPWNAFAARFAYQLCRRSAASCARSRRVGFFPACGAADSAGSVAASGALPGGALGAGAGSRSVKSACASPAGPRRVPIASTRIARTRAPCAKLSVSPGVTVCAALVQCRPLIRSRPDWAISPARPRVLKKRACQSHLSTRRRGGGLSLKAHGFFNLARIAKGLSGSIGFSKRFDGPLSWRGAPWFLPPLPFFFGPGP